jgi:hypothetical protein
MTRYKLSEGRDDVAVELGDRRGARPADRVGDTGFFDTGYGSKAGFAESATRDDGETVIDTLAFAFALGTEP